MIDPEQEVNLIPLAALEMTQTCAGALEVTRCKLLNPGSGHGITTCQRTFGVIPSPNQIRDHPMLLA